MPESYKFDFGTAEAEEGYVKVTENTVYDAETGFGFDSVSRVSAKDRGEPGEAGLRRDFCILPRAWRDQGGRARRRRVKGASASTVNIVYSIVGERCASDEVKNDCL
ncbi:hypothetical protein [Paenibacillus alkalitolerans]|uniref:hypothetical protein n=1 Tax=Paenibacillus alkalitolerans TaxID=2799335 RepID=UPI0018F4AC66|nr:hypothetical protein [Paenibacillus alkalitolerans]